MTRDIEQTKELIVAIIGIIAVAIKYFRDGIQVSDFANIATELLTDKDFREKILRAFDGLSEIPQELRDLDIAEIIELLVASVKESGKIIVARK